MTLDNMLRREEEFERNNKEGCEREWTKSKGLYMRTTRKKPKCRRGIRKKKWAETTN